MMKKPIEQMTDEELDDYRSSLQRRQMRIIGKYRVRPASRAEGLLYSIRDRIDMAYDEEVRRALIQYRAEIPEMATINVGDKLLVPNMYSIHWPDGAVNRVGVIAFWQASWLCHKKCYVLRAYITDPPPVVSNWLFPFSNMNRLLHMRQAYLEMEAKASCDTQES